MIEVKYLKKVELGLNLHYWASKHPNAEAPAYKIIAPNFECFNSFSTDQNFLSIQVSIILLYKGFSSDHSHKEKESASQQREFKSAPRIKVEPLK